jgi:4-aminobutyrate aminotransferase-like enzyme
VSRPAETCKAEEFGKERFADKGRPKSRVSPQAVRTNRIVKRENLGETCAEIGKLLEVLLRKTFEQCKCIGDIRGRRLF